MNCIYPAGDTAHAMNAEAIKTGLCDLYLGNFSFILKLKDVLCPDSRWYEKYNVGAFM
jgi:hypothetical protein